MKKKKIENEQMMRILIGKQMKIINTIQGIYD